MNILRHLHYKFMAVLLIIFTANIGHSQVAICKNSITVSTEPWSCTYKVLPSDINNGSTGYDILSVDDNVISFLGDNIVTLRASKLNGSSSTCTCLVKLADKAAPVVVMKQNVTVALNDQNYLDILPDMVDNGSFDQCSAVTLSVSPSYIDCNSSNPLKVFLTVTDSAGNYNQSWTFVEIIQNKNRLKDLICRSNVTFGVPSVGDYTITADSLLEGGPYACNSAYTVELMLNNVKRPSPNVNKDDVGKTFDYTMTDIETQNTCSGTVTIIALDCTNSFFVCDTESMCTPVGDCASGHTLSDDIEWPCDITINNALTYLYNNPTPQKIADYMKIPVSDIEPVLFNGQINTNKCLLIGKNIQADLFPTQNLIRFRYTYINWNDQDKQFGPYDQYITLDHNNNTPCNVCDSKAWNTPTGTCDSGHTLDDAVEWPADITVDFEAVSPYDLSINPSVNPNDVAPRLSALCSTISIYSYNDVVNPINTNTNVISRTWTIYDSQSLQIYSYIQTIRVIFPVNSDRRFCFSTMHEVPIIDVKIGDNILSGSEGCNTLQYEPSGKIVRPFKADNDFQSGLDVEDVIMLKEYNFKLRTLSDMQLSAADMNNNGQIDNNDATILNDLLNNDISTLTSFNSPWKFIHANSYFYKNMDADSIDITSPFETYHFKGMKHGDLNDSYNRDENLQNSTILTVNDLVLNEGQSYGIKFSNKNDLRMKGMQIAIAKNEAFEIDWAISPHLDIKVIDKGDHFLLVGLSEDQYIKGNGQPLDELGSVLKLNFIAKKNAVLHDIFKLYDEGNKMVEGGGKGSSKIQLEYNGSIPTSSLDFKENSISIYPNPTQGIISIDSPDMEIATVQFISINGNVVQTSNDMSNNSIDISNLSNGFYTIHLTMKDGRKVAKKLIKI